MNAAQPADPVLSDDLCDAYGVPRGSRRSEVQDDSPGGAPGSTDAERAAWLADKIAACGDYAKEAAAMLRRWPADGVPASDHQTKAGNTP